VEKLLRMGADKIAVNTAATKRPGLITEIAERFGSQCMVISIEAKRISDGVWEAYTDNGREKTGLDVIQWVRKAQVLGAGEILLTSVDQEGTRKGFDVELTRKVSTSVHIPVIASGGMGTVDHLIDVIQKGKADAVAMADILHYERMTLGEIKKTARDAGIDVSQR
jgi:cyclase